MTSSDNYVEFMLVVNSVLLLAFIDYGPFLSTVVVLRNEKLAMHKRD